MTDTTTIDLYAVLRDETLLAHLHDLQRARCAEDALTGGQRPHGMRLSTADPVRRVKAFFDPFWNVHIDEGVGMRGHMLEDFLEVMLFHAPDARFENADYESQVAVQWHEHGRTAFDFVVSHGGDRIVSCKSSIKDTKPSAANRAQEARMLALGGYAPGTEWETFLINPSTMRAVGPFVDTLTDEDVSDARAELSAVDKAFRYWMQVDNHVEHEGWNDAAYWRRMFNLESTSGAFRLESLDASGAVEARNRAYLRARAVAKEAKAAEDAAKAVIRQHVVEQVELLGGGRVTAYSGDEIATYSIDKRGAMRVTLKAAEAADAA